MLERCYSNKYQIKNPSYVGSAVAAEWKTFSKFKAWMETQDWVGKELDKDILFHDNKLYSPDTCVFVNQNVNSFFTAREARGEYMIGVSWHERHKKFLAQCKNGFGKKIHLGCFDDELEAHLAWKAYKHDLAYKLAEEQSDQRVAEALRKRFAPETNLEGT